MKQSVYPYIAEEIKSLLKKRSISYKNLAKYLMVSEKTVIRSLNNKQELTFDRLSQICALLGINMSELIAMAEQNMGAVHYFTEEQDEAMSANPLLYELLLLVFDEQDIGRLARMRQVPKTDIYLELRELERLELVSLGTNDRISIRVPKHTVFHPESRYAAMVIRHAVAAQAEVCCKPGKKKGGAQVKVVNVTMSDYEYKVFIEGINSQFVQLLRSHHTPARKGKTRVKSYTISLMASEGNFYPEFSELVENIKTR